MFVLLIVDEILGKYRGVAAASAAQVIVHRDQVVACLWRYPLELNRFKCTARISGVFYRSNFLLVRWCSLHQGQYHMSLSRSESLRAQTSLDTHLRSGRSYGATGRGASSCGAPKEADRKRWVCLGLSSFDSLPNTTPHAFKFQSTITPSPRGTSGPLSKADSSAVKAVSEHNATVPRGCCPEEDCGALQQ